MQKDTQVRGEVHEVQEPVEGRSNVESQETGVPRNVAHVQVSQIPCELVPVPQSDPDPDAEPSPVTSHRCDSSGTAENRDETETDTRSSIEQVMRLNPTYPPRPPQTARIAQPENAKATPVRLILPKGAVPATLPTYPAPSGQNLQPILRQKIRIPIQTGASNLRIAPASNAPVARQQAIRPPTPTPTATNMVRRAPTPPTPPVPTTTNTPSPVADGQTRQNNAQGVKKEQTPPPPPSQPSGIRKLFQKLRWSNADTSTPGTQVAQVRAGGGGGESTDTQRVKKHGPGDVSIQCLYIDTERICGHQKDKDGDDDDDDESSAGEARDLETPVPSEVTLRPLVKSPSAELAELGTFQKKVKYTREEIREFVRINTSLASYVTQMKAMLINCGDYKSVIDETTQRGTEEYLTLSRELFAGAARNEVLRMRLKAIRKQVREKTREAARVNKEEIQRMETQLHAMSPGMHSRWMEVKNVVNEKKARAALKGIQDEIVAGQIAAALVQTRINALRIRRTNIARLKFKPKPLDGSPRTTGGPENKRALAHKVKKAKNSDDDDDTDSDETEDVEVERPSKNVNRAPAGSTRPHASSDAFTRPLSVNFPRRTPAFQTTRIGFNNPGNVPPVVNGNAGAQPSQIPVPGYRSNAARLNPTLIPPKANRNDNEENVNEGFQTIPVEIIDLAGQQDDGQQEKRVKTVCFPWSPMTSDEEDQELSSNDNVPKQRAARKKVSPSNNDASEWMDLEQMLEELQIDESQDPHVINIDMDFEASDILRQAEEAIIDALVDFDDEDDSSVS